MSEEDLEANGEVSGGASRGPAPNVGSAVRVVLAVAGRDLGSLLLSPLAWATLATVQLVVGVVFVVQLQIFLDPPRVAALASGWGLTRLVAAPVLNWGAFLLMLVTPLVAMRSLSDEWRLGTAPLLLSAPISATHIVTAKYLALVTFLWTQVALIAALPLTLLVGGSLDWGLYAAALLGMLLLGGAFAAVGLAASSLTRQPAAAAMGGLSVLLLLWLLSWRGPGHEVGSLAGWFHYLSWQTHLDPMLRGVVDTTDVVYFVLVATTGLVVAARRVATAPYRPNRS